MESLLDQLPTLWGLVLDAWHTKDWKAKFTLWFRPTGWRPADVTKKYPRPYWDNVHAQENMPQSYLRPPPHGPFFTG